MARHSTVFVMFFFFYVSCFYNYRIDGNETGQGMNFDATACIKIQLAKHCRTFNQVGGLGFPAGGAGLAPLDPFILLRCISLSAA